jgi:hypothetical protein
MHRAPLRRHHAPLRKHRAKYIFLALAIAVEITIYGICHTKILVTTPRLAVRVVEPENDSTSRIGSSNFGKKATLIFFGSAFRSGLEITVAVGRTLILWGL